MDETSHGRCGDIRKILARHHEQRLDLRSHLAVRESHLELVLEIGIDPHAANDGIDPMRTAELNEKRIKALDNDVGQTGLLYILADHRHAHIAVEHRALLGTRSGDRHDQPVVKGRSPLDKVEMT